MEGLMRRTLLSVALGSALGALAAGPAQAGTSLLGAGETNWFYACGNDQAMNIVVRHVDRTTTAFSLLPGEHLRGFVRQGDVEAWRCGGPVDAAALYLYVVTVP
jgi:hypothetical protein